VTDSDRFGPDDLLTVAVAAAEASRSVRTIRRAYRRGVLTAHRDGNGRSVRIRYRDLRRWMMAEPADSPRAVDGAAAHRHGRQRQSANVWLLEEARRETG
jgi:excisionase family DNA binding protein